MTARRSSWLRDLLLFAGLIFIGGAWIVRVTSPQATPSPAPPAAPTVSDATQQTIPTALAILAQIPIKGRAPKTDYTRERFYKTWPLVNGCSLRQNIIRRELGDSAITKDCQVISGHYIEPYTGKTVQFTSKAQIQKQIQIDHVVALADAWQKGAQQLSPARRLEFATDPMNLLAVDATANMLKSASDAASWLPHNQAFRCQYVARQISVKYKYQLWNTEAETVAMRQVLERCPSEPILQ